MNFSFLGSVKMLIATTLFTAALCAGQTYTITDLGDSLGGTSSGARAINASGQITGYAYRTGNSVTDVFLYSGGVMTDLGTLGGTTGLGLGINASGQVTGYSTTASGNYRAFISNNGTLTDIGDLGGGSSDAYAINDLGQAVGASYMANS